MQSYYSTVALMPDTSYITVIKGGRNENCKLDSDKKNDAKAGTSIGKIDPIQVA